ncbi:hypothetical protein pb186bvf_002178 [Paramecium bursaria]
MHFFIHQICLKLLESRYTYQVYPCQFNIFCTIFKNDKYA